MVIERCKLEDDAEFMAVAMNEAGKDTSTCHLCVTRRTVPEEFKDEMQEVCAAYRNLFNIFPNLFLTFHKFQHYFLPLNLSQILLNCSVVILC